MSDCIQDNIPTTDNTSLVCDELISTECLIHDKALPALEILNGATVSDILNKVSDKIYSLFLKEVKNQNFSNVTTLTVVHNKGYYPLIQFKSLPNAVWSVNHVNINKFIVTFTTSSTDTIIYA